MEGQGISLGTQVISMSFNFGQFQFIFLLEHMTRLVASWKIMQTSHIFTNVDLFRPY